MKMDNLTKSILEWFLYGDVGTSSKSLLAATFNMEDKNWISYPHDGGDLNRCFLLINKIPECRKGLEKLAKIHPNWKVIFENWDELTTLLGLGHDNKCYYRMQELYKGITHKNEVKIGNGVTIRFKNGL